MIKIPHSLRSGVSVEAINARSNIDASTKVTLACIVAAGSIGTAEAQQAPLPAVTVDAPVARPRPPAAKPTAEELRVRAALRRQAARRAAQQAAPVSTAPASTQAPDANPYADPNAPYKGDRLASPKFTEPLLNTPRSVTVLTKELLADKNATSLKEVARTTAGVTLGTGEGGNAFGDRFFIRGFDARNDIFVDGIRDAAISVRENFFTEQVEILRGPASSFAGRGTTGGALNIVTKQAGDRNFYNAETTFGTDLTKRVTVDVNQVINPTLSVRANAMWQNADVAGRKYVRDDRWGGLAAVKWAPTDAFKVTANYIHVEFDQLPDFGVPYNRAAQLPYTSINVPRDTYYGFVNRDFQKTTQDIATVNGEYVVNDYLTLNNKTRVQRSILNYIGTLPQSPTATTVSLSGQSRYQIADQVANVADATFKFDTGPVRHAVVVGSELSRESIKRDTYAGLTAELSAQGFNVSGNSVTGSIFDPPNLAPFSGPFGLTGNPTFIGVNTKSAYLIETANYNDFIILNGGLRYDDYEIDVSSRGGAVNAHSGMVNWNAGAVVKPLPNVSLYGAYATSSNPVGAELDANGSGYGGLSPTVANQVFDPERNTAIEVGVKTELFDRRLAATLALFQTEKNNARETVSNVVFAGASYRVRGVDIGLAGKITDAWSIFAGAVFMDSEILSSITPANVGLKMAGFSHESFNLLTKYNVTSNWEVGGQATYKSKLFGGTSLAANNGNVLPAFWRFDLFTEYKIDKNFKVKLFVNNIFDTIYYDAFYVNAGAPFTYIAPGRSAYLVLSAKF